MSSQLNKHNTVYKKSFQQKVSFFIPSIIVLIFTLIGIINSLKYSSKIDTLNFGEEILSSTHKEKKWTPNPIEKHLSAVKIELESADDIPNNSDQAPLLIRGSIVLNHAAANSATYKWLLPEGVTIVKGSVSGVLNHSALGQRQYVELTVIGFDQMEKKIITLIAEADISHQIYGASAVLSSRPQDSMEYIAPEMKAAADQFAEEGAL